MAEEKEHLGKELFIAGYDGDMEVGELTMFDSLSELKEYLSNMSPVSEGNLTALHGILTSAECIPEDLGRGVYVIVVDANDEENGCLHEFTSGDPDGLAELIEEIVSAKHKELGDLTIDNVFLLFGYELNMCLSISGDEIDEQVIEDSQKVADVANEMRKKLLNAEE